jgi:hypothetical protein
MAAFYDITNVVKMACVSELVFLIDDFLGIADSLHFTLDGWLSTLVGVSVSLENPCYCHLCTPCNNDDFYTRYVLHNDVSV